MRFFISRDNTMSEKTEKNYFRAQIHHYLLYFSTSQRGNYPTTQLPKTYLIQIFIMTPAGREKTTVRESAVNSGPFLQSYIKLCVHMYDEFLVTYKIVSSC